MNKKNIFESCDDILEILEKKPKKRGRPKKVIEEKPSVIEINEERFKEEDSRIRSYLGKVSMKQMGPSEMISILQDLEVIIETNGLSKDEIIEQLKELLQGK